MKFTIAILFICAVSAGNTLAMDRFAALSMIESGDNDLAIGRCGEVSRYQISPGVCRQYEKSCDSLTNPLPARALAVRIMQDRTAQFTAVHQRAPTDFEWYLLWHRPGRVMDPTRREKDRWQLNGSANLCSR